MKLFTLKAPPPPHTHSMLPSVSPPSETSPVALPTRQQIFKGPRLWGQFLRKQQPDPCYENINPISPVPILNSIESSSNTGNKISDSSSDLGEPILYDPLPPCSSWETKTQFGLEWSTFLSPTLSPCVSPLCGQRRDLASIQVYVQRSRS